MSCKFYTFKDGDYYCMKKGEDVSSDWYYRYCRNYDYDECPIYKEDSSSGGCYLTSACVESKGLADDCVELQILRNYRDTWLKKTEEGQKLILQYYELAPKIVKSINNRDNAKEIYEMIYAEMVLPCVEMIKQRKMEMAMEMYKAMTLRLKKEFC